MRWYLAALVSAALILDGQGLSGRRAPSFSLPDSKLVQHDILDYRGNWLIVDFMQTNCPHCKALSKTLEGLKAKFGARLAVLSVVLPPDNLGTVAKYIQENKITVPVLFDSSQVAVSYFKSTPTSASFATPHWFVIDPRGTIVRDWGQAFAEGQEWVKEFDRLMAK